MNLKLASGFVTCCVLMALSNVSFAADCTAPHSIKQVKNSSPRGPYEYVIFDIVSSPNLPYSVSTATGPFISDPSGLPVSVNGSKFKNIRFTDVFWTCTIKENFSLPKIAIKDVKLLGQFEGVVEYVVGYSAAPRYLNTYASQVGSNWKVVMRFKKYAY